MKAIYQLPKGADEDVEAIGVKSLITASFEVAKYQTYWENLTDTTKEIDIPDYLPQIKGYSDRLASVFSNLIINAYQAMTQAGIKSTEERILRITAKVSDDPSFVEIHMANKGSLIQAKDLENIFNSGFSTKEKGKGLGLHICKIQVEEFNKGRIYARNIEGFGPDFVVELPVWVEETDDSVESS